MSNRLINEKSQYLLQHALNPVDWYPWSELAFEKAKNENKPVFLSIGYSTCHWCHVMERESFEDENVAEILNRAFVSIKVDREERPDIDAVYMSVCQMLTGSGGWPMTIIMTPDKLPFFAGTYFPRESKWGKPGLIDLLLKVDEIWRNEREKLLQSSKEITDSLLLEPVKKQQGEFTKDVFHKAFKQLSGSYDKINGGFGSSPKFPMPHNISFLLGYYHNFKDDKALEMAELTLRKMSNGGIFDHLGGGFHRYSTDEKWLVPHFEKMLYDQTLLTIAYTEAFQITKNESYKTTSEQTLNYLLRDMTSPEGGFYSAEDADSEGMEGKFYIWKLDEIRQILGEDADEFIKTYNISPVGNFTEHTGHIPKNSNILHLNESLIKDKFAESRNKLLSERNKRIHPLKDDKILVDWNGLAIAAFAKAYSVFHDEKYLKAAENAVHFILNNLLRNDGSLFHRYRDGEAAFDGNLDDYAFLCFGLMELYEASGKIEYLKKTFELTDYLLEHFQDTKDGGFFFTSDISEKLIIRKKEMHDGAIPSGNSIMLFILSKLWRISENEVYKVSAENLLNYINNEMSNYPAGYTMMLCSAIFLKSEPLELVIVSDEEYDTNIGTVTEQFLPRKVLLYKNKNNSEEITKLSPFTENYTALNRKTTYYLCRNYQCDIPVRDINELLKKIF